MCKGKTHQACLHMSDEEFDTLSKGPDLSQWCCARCRLIKANNIKWGQHTGESDLRCIITSIYRTIVGWRRNIFRLPRGKSGTEFIKELTRLLNLFVDKTKWERLALPLVHIFIPLMLQNPSPKSKPRVHSKYLTLRLTKWKEGNLQSLMQEMVEIQKRLKLIKENKKKVDAAQKAFVKLIFVLNVIPR